MIRVITEEEPSKPSTRLSTADALPSLAAARQTEPKRLTALLRGELDWVVMKCLAKDRERRYESAAGLALDVERHLSGEPVAACPPSRAYLARKFIRRHRGPMIAAVSLLTLLVAGIVGTSWGLIEAKAATDRERKAKNEAISEGRRAEEQARTAKEEAKIAQMERQFLLVDLLGQADPAVQAETIREAGGGTPVKENPTIKELLDRCALKATPDNLATRFPEEKRVQTAVLGALGRAFYGIGEYQRAADHLQRAVNLSIDAFGPAHDDCLCHMRNLALVYVLIDRAADAVKLHEQVRDALTARLGSDADATLDALACLAAAYRSNGQPDKAVPLMEEVLAKQQQRHGPADKATWPVRNNLALALANMGKTDRAITILNSLQDDQTAALPPGDPTLLLTRHNLALIYIEAGQPSKAIELAAGVLEERRKLFGPNHPVTQSSQHNLASAYRDSGNYKKSAELYEQLLEQRRRQLGPDDSATVNTANGLAKVYYHGRQPAKAVALWEEILTIRLRQFGVDHPKTMVTVSNLAHCYRNVPDYPKSIANFRRLLDYETNAYGREDRRTQYTLNTMAIVCKMSGDYEQALPLLREAVDFAERNGWKDRDSHRMVDNLILVLEKLGKADEAEAWKKKQPPEPK
jgi:tetratricopeptide (TPR) repeat protein